MTISPVDIGSAALGAAPDSIPPFARMRKVPFAALYAYSPSGSDPASRRSRRVCAAIKAADPPAIARAIAEMRGIVAVRPDLQDGLGAHVWLVPVPGSEPRWGRAPDVARALAEALAGAGFGAGVRSVLVRHQAVRKSATAPAGARPSIAQHYASLAVVDVDFGKCDELVLVDDVVTRGRTLLAAACRLRTAFPEARIRAFALLRTMGFVAGVRRLVDPCVGEIRWQRGDAWREP